MSKQKSNVSRVLPAVAIVLFMIASSFFTLVVSAQSQPTIWTTKAEYTPGEQVVLYGTGFASGGKVTITFTYLDTVLKQDTWPVGYNGEFRYDNYTAEWVSDYSVPVVVTAYQDASHQAQTQFFDPEVSVLAWALLPHPKWEKRDIKGYNEGDSIPMQVQMSKPVSTDVVGVTIGLDFIDTDPMPVYGFDYLTQYNLEPPSAPFNIYPNSSQPFTVDPAEGTLLYQSRLANQYEPGQTMLIWNFTVQFAPGSTVVHVRFGAHLALTALPDYLGASYYPGSSLHVDIVALNPSFDSGNRDVPIPVREILTPPHLEMTKECSPEEVVEGDVITFTIKINNTGQATATCVDLNDSLPLAVNYLPGSTMFWTDSHSPASFPDPTFVDGNSHLLNWFLGIIPGTTSNSGEVFEEYLSFQATVVTNVVGTYTNWVFLNYTDDHGGSFPTVIASCDFHIAPPGEIQLVKDCQEYAHVGDEITYTYTVTNTGPIDLVNVTIKDDIVGLIVNGETLDVDETKVFYGYYTVQADDANPLVNIAIVTAQDLFGRTVTDTDTCSVVILKPAIEVTKTSKFVCAAVDDKVTYTITVKNTGIETTLYNVTVDDSLLGVIATGLTLTPGQSETYIVTYTVVSPYPDPLVNTATATGEDLLNMEVTSSASWSINIFHPAIEITKVGDKDCAIVGEVVTYTITVTNPSLDTWMNFTVSDTLFGLDFWTGMLTPGQAAQKVMTRTVLVTDPDPLVNTASVTATDSQGHVRSASASWEVDIVHPDIDVTKESLGCAAAGDTLTYFINVTNNGDIALDVVVTDDMFGGIIYDGVIAAHTTVPLVETHLVTVNDPDPLKNTVYVVGEDECHHMVRASASWSVDILHPGIELTKTANPTCGAVGDVISYTFVITNPSDDTPMYAVLSDPMFGTIYEGWIQADSSATVTRTHTITIDDSDPLVNTATVDAHDAQGHTASATASATVDVVHPAVTLTKTADKVCGELGELVTYTLNVSNPASADVWLNGTVVDPLAGFTGTFANLVPGGWVLFTVPYTVTANTLDPFTNTATVVATDHQQHQVTASAKWTIDILHPAIDISKTADVDCAIVGQIVTYTITVTNPSLDTAMYAMVNDSLLGQLFVGTIPAMGVQTLIAPYTISASDSDPLVNIVTVWAKDSQNHVRTDAARWTIDILHPQLTVVKHTSDFSTCAAAGDTVTYVINVSNPSTDTPMAGTIQDPVLGIDLTFDLGPGQWLEITGDLLVGPQTPDPLVNIVYANGTDKCGNMVNVSATWTVDILHPMINLDKTADVRCAALGDVITYTLNVSNPSSDTIMTAILSDPMFGGELWTGTLLPGQWHVVTVTHEVTLNDLDPLVNEAIVTAVDTQNHPARSSSSWTVDILHPMIGVTKSGPMYGHAGDLITYTYVITNLALDTDLFNVTAVDDKLGLVFSGNLPRGASVTATATTTLAGDPDPLQNVVVVNGEDKQHHPANGMARWSVIILEPVIDVEKTCPGEASPGDTIIYHIVVTNVDTDDTVLYNVTVTDTLLGFVALIPVLGLGESRTFDVPYLVPAHVGLIENVVTATGEDLLHMWASDVDSCSLFVTGQVSGFKFLDVDHDHEMGQMDIGIGNWLIYLNGTLANGSTDTRTRLTDSSGFYMFTDLHAGVYTIEEQMISGWTNITPRSFSFTVTSGAVFILSFQNSPTGSISGFKYLDEDMDAKLDADEMPVSGWTITLTWSVAGVPMSMSTTTDENGFYQFTGLLPAVYTVTEETRVGWVHTSPDSITVDVSANVPFNVEGINFFNVQTGSIHGFKWLDEFMNGYRDGNEPKLAGWTIVLNGTTFEGKLIGPLTTVTDEFGAYAFDNLPPGIYTVREIIPEGWVNVTPSSRLITVEAGVIVTCAKFGNVQYGCIKGWKYLDLDQDGMKDGNEVGIPGWSITLTGFLNDGDIPLNPLNATVITPITVVTNATGGWKFEHLLPGVYTVTEESRDGWMHVTPATLHFWIASGTCVIDVKFGNVPLACIQGYKFSDLNFDGINESEPGVPGWTIYLNGTQLNGVLVHLTTVTDDAGFYKFCNLLPGRYVVQEGSRVGWTNTTPKTVVVTIPAIPAEMGKTIYRVDFGNFKFGLIIGTKYEDVNGNGVYDQGIDRPIEGWKMTLTGRFTGIAYTNASGGFEFPGLTYGLWTVTEDDRAGWEHMNAPFQTVFVHSGEHVTLIPFLNSQFGDICGVKYEDRDGDGVRDNNGNPDPGIMGWEIQLLDASGNLLRTAFTDPNGSFCFEDVLAGTYYVREVPREGWTPTTPTMVEVHITSGTQAKVSFGNFHNAVICAFKYEDVNSNGVFDNGDKPIAGWNMTFSGPGILGGTVTIPTGANGRVTISVTAPGQYTITEENRAGWTHINPVSGVRTAFLLSHGHFNASFGNFKNVLVEVCKFEDVNCNSIYDAGDRPIAGWQVTVSGPLLLVTRVTGADGCFIIELNRSGIYTFTEESRQNWTPTTPPVVTLTIESGYALQHVEFGNFHNVKVVIFKYADTCSNGVYNPELGDYGIARWPFVVLGTGEPGFLEGITDEHGYLNFTVTCAGEFEVYEADIPGWDHINPADGMLEFSAESGDQPILLQFGNYPVVHVPVLKYEDVNCDGRYEPGIDRVVQGWDFTMTREGGGATFTGTTGPNGMVVIDVNRSGIYRLVEEDVVGWTHKNPVSGERIVIITGGITVPVQEFGNFKNVTVTVFKFDDIDGDGAFDPPQDVPIAGWMFTLNKEVGDDTAVMLVPIATKLTDADGLATFYINCSGEYVIREENRLGWFHISPASGQVVLDDVMSGSGPYFLEFANFKYGMITGTKYNDLNGNGVLDPGEPALPGWTVWFHGSTGMTGFLVTDQNGEYNFTGLIPGEYRVTEILQPGWVPTSAPELSVIIVGHSHEVVNFLNFELGCIEGYKYEDVNGNGIRDGNDMPVMGWPVILSRLGPGGLVLVATTGTNADGHYEFCGLGPGTYLVQEGSREGWVPTNSTEASVTLTSGAEVRVHDFMNFRLGEICVFKYEDLNANGQKDENEPFLPGWEIVLMDAQGNLIRSGVTNEDGVKCFTGLLAGNYIVAEALKNGWTNTTPLSVRVTIVSGTDSHILFGNFENVTLEIFKYEDVNGNRVYDTGDLPIGGWLFEVSGPQFLVPITVATDPLGFISLVIVKPGVYTIAEEMPPGWTNTTAPVLSVTVSSGATLPVQRFGNMRPGSIEIFKFDDLNMNGAQDDNELGLANFVYWVNGTLTTGGYLNFTRMTDSLGHASVVGLPAGTYVVSEKLLLSPPGWAPTTSTVEIAAIHSGSVASFSFGNVLLGNITGNKFYDKDLDGVWDALEPGLGGWTITLTGMTDGGVPVSLSRVTDAAGHYAFIGIPTGVYDVSEIVQLGFTATTSIPVLVDVSGVQVPFEEVVNIGNVRLAEIHGYKFLDRYGNGAFGGPNGIFDPTESGIGNWEITLQGRTDTGVLVNEVRLTDNIDDIGYYQFAGLMPGRYWVNETLLIGFYATTPIANLVMVPSFPLGPFSWTINFGNTIPSPDPQIPFELNKGWNLWSMPIVVNGLTAKDLLKAIGPNGQAVTKLDKAADRYMSYVSGYADAYNFPIVTGQGYYVYVKQTVTFTLKGDLTGAGSIPVSKGWNIVGYNNMESTTASELLGSVSGTNARAVSWLDGQTKTYHSFVKGYSSAYDFAISPGRAYFIYVDGAGTLAF